jgi:hypothetical protein
MISQTVTLPYNVGRCGENVQCHFNMHLWKLIIFLLLLGKASVYAATQLDVESFKIALVRWQQTKHDTDYHAVMRLYETLHNDTIRPQWLQTARTIAASYGINIEQLYQAYITPPPPPVCPTPQPPQPLPPTPEQPSTIPPIIPSPEQPPVPVTPPPETTPPNPLPEQPLQPEIPLTPQEPTPPVVAPPVIPEPEQPPVIPEQPETPEPTNPPQPPPPIVLPTPVEPPTESEQPFVAQDAEEEFCLASFILSLLNPTVRRRFIHHLCQSSIRVHVSTSST